MITTFENRCVLKFHVIVLRPIFDTKYKGEIQVGSYMRSLHHELLLFQQSRIFFQYVPDNEFKEDILVWNPSREGERERERESNASLVYFSKLHLRFASLF